jgi:hypothetical protein
MTTRAAAILFVTIAAAPGGAAASPLFELAGGAGGQGGFNARTTGASSASTYFNPALLVEAEPGLVVGTFVLGQHISIAVDARDGAAVCAAGACDVPAVFGTGPESFRHEDGSALAEPTVPTAWLEEGKGVGEPGAFAPRPRQGQGSGEGTLVYQVVGLVTPVFGKRAVLGFHAMVPLAEFTTARAFYNDEREQFFSNSLHPELYSDRLTSTSLALGVGSQITQRLSLGVSLTLALRNRAEAPVYVSNLSNLDTVLLDSDVGVEAAVAPHFGVVWDPIDHVRLTATLHTEQAFEIDTSFSYVLATGSEQSASVHFTHAWLPWTAALGSAWTVGRAGRHRLDLVATLTFSRWSEYQDRHSERPHPDYAWSDTLSGAFGLRHSAGRLASWIDLAYQPSPVPAQTGRSNYVDNDRIGLSAGLERELELWGGTFRLNIGVQAHRLVSRHVTKFVTPDNPQPNPNQPGFGDNYYPQLVIDEVPDDAIDGQLGEPVPGRDGLQTNNPGFPGFGSEGWILGGGVSLTIVY